MEFNVLSVVQLIGGLALFIYGMTTMGKGLERAAGSKLEKTLEKMTGNVFKALLMGLVVTMVIQSSSATTVMVVGFVNAAAAYRGARRPAPQRALHPPAGGVHRPRAPGQQLSPSGSGPDRAGDC